MKAGLLRPSVARESLARRDTSAASKLAIAVAAPASLIHHNKDGGWTFSLKYRRHRGVPSNLLPLPEPLPLLLLSEPPGTVGEGEDSPSIRSLR